MIAMKNIISAFSGKKLLFLLAIPLIAAGCGSQKTAENSNANMQSQSQAQGRAVFSITDASASLQNISSVTLTVDKLEVHSTSTDQGWVVVSTQPKTFDLLQLKQSGLAQILADVQIATGTYDQIRLHVTNVTVVKAGVASQAKLPSNELKIVGKVVVGQNGTASVLLDFMLDKSLHLTGNGTFIFTPVIKLDSKSDAQVNVKSDNSVEVQGGKEEENETVGMDADGEVKVNFQLDDSKDKLDLTSDGVIHVMENDQSETAVKISADQAVQISLKNNSIDVAISVKLETQNGKKVWHVSGTRALVLVNVFVDANSGTIVSIQ